MTRSGVRFFSPEPIQYTVRWRTWLGEHGSTYLMAHGAVDARNRFRRKWPHREVITPVMPTRNASQERERCLELLTT